MKDLRTRPRDPPNLTFDAFKIFELPRLAVSARVPSGTALADCPPDVTPPSAPPSFDATDATGDFGITGGLPMACFVAIMGDLLWEDR